MGDDKAVTAKQWQGKGLPASAVRRVAQTNESGLRASLLSVADFALAETVGLVPRGIVVGCRGERVDWGEFGLGEAGCGYVPQRLAVGRSGLQTDYNRQGGSGGASTTGFVPSAQISVGLNFVTNRARQGPVEQEFAKTPQSVQLEGAYAVAPIIYTHAGAVPLRSAVERMVEEARAIGADGVIDVQLTTEQHNQMWQFTARGTAVSVSGGWQRPAFSTTLSGADVLKLLTSGYAPASVAIGMTLGIVHDLSSQRIARNRFGPVREIPHLTQLVNDSRKHARGQLGSAVQKAGASGVILTSRMTLDIESHAVSSSHHDVVVTVQAVGSTITAIDGLATQSLHKPLAILAIGSRADGKPTLR